MPTFGNMKSLCSYLQKRIDNALGDEVFETVKQTEQESIEDVVYGAYIPGTYSRRGEDGGIGDTNNIVLGSPVTNGVLEVVNVTEPNPYLNGIDESDGYADTEKNLPELIERGHGYKGYGYDIVRTNAGYMKPRPFTQETINRLADTKDHVYALKRGLIKQGIAAVDDKAGGDLDF